MEFEIGVKTAQEIVPLPYDHHKDESAERRLARWFINGDVGLSSTSLAAWCMSIKDKWQSHPHDASDRMRCINCDEAIVDWGMAVETNDGEVQCGSCNQGAVVAAHDMIKHSQQGKGADVRR